MSRWMTDNCDECGRSMRLTGDSLCGPCRRVEDDRFTCAMCGEATLYDWSTCCPECDRAAYEALLEDVDA